MMLSKLLNRIVFRKRAIRDWKGVMYHFKGKRIFSHRKTFAYKQPNADIIFHIYETRGGSFVTCLRKGKSLTVIEVFRTKRQIVDHLNETARSDIADKFKAKVPIEERLVY